MLYFGDQVTPRHGHSEEVEESAFLMRVFQLEPAKLERLLYDVLREECGRWRGVVRVAPDLLSGEPQERPNLAYLPPPPSEGTPWQQSLQSPTLHVGAAPGVAANVPSPDSSPRPCTATLQGCTVEFEGENEEAMPLNAIACLGTTGRIGAHTPPRCMETGGTDEIQLARDESRASEIEEANPTLVAPHLATRMPMYGAVGMAFRSPGAPGAYAGCEPGGGGPQTETSGHARATSGSCTPMPTRDYCMSPTSRGTAAMGATGGVPMTSSSNFFGHMATAYSFSRPSLPTDAGNTSRYGYANGCTGRLSMMGHRNQPQLDPGTLIIQEGCASKGGPDFISASANSHVAHQQPQAPAATAAAAAAATVTTSKYVCPLGFELGDIPESAAASTSRTSTGMRWDSCGNPLATSTFGLALGRQYEGLPAAATPMFALASMVPSPNSYHHHPTTCHASSGPQGGVRVLDMCGQRKSTSQRMLSIGHSATPRAIVAGFGRSNSTVKPSSTVPNPNPATAPGLNVGGRATVGRVDSAGSRVLAFASSLRNAPMAAQVLAEGSITSRASSLQRPQDGSQSPARLEATLAAAAAAGCGGAAASPPAMPRTLRITDQGMRALATLPRLPSLSPPALKEKGAAGGALRTGSGASTLTCLLPGSGLTNDPWDTCGTSGRCTSMLSGGTSPIGYFAVKPNHDGSYSTSTRNGATHRLGSCSMGVEQGRLLASAAVQELMIQDAEEPGTGADGTAASIQMAQPSPAARPGATGALTAGPDLPTVDWPLTSAATSGSGRETVGTAGHPGSPSFGEQQQAAHAAQQARGSSVTPQSQAQAQHLEPQDGGQQHLEPQDGPLEGCECWHEVWATRAVDPVTRQEVIVVSQHDVTAKVVAERHLAMVMEAEHRLLEQLFPKHILTHITEEWIAEAERAVAAVAADNGPRVEGGGGHGRVRKSSSAKSNRWRPVVRDCNALATWHPQVTLLFADIKGFTPMCEQVSPRAVMTMLNDLFSRFDCMLDNFGVFKVETIGDCYFVAGGLIHEGEDGMAAVRDVNSKGDPLHAERVLMFAKAMLAAAREVRMPTSGQRVQVRIGIHSGPVVSGVVGTRMPRFCLFGDTVNTTSRMESTGVPGAIHASADACALLRSEAWEPTGGVEVKGKGLMQTYLWRPLLGEEDDGTERKLPACAAAAAAALANVVSAAHPPPLAIGDGRNADEACAVAGKEAVADVTGGSQVAGVGRTAGAAIGGAEPTVTDVPAPARGGPGGEGCVDAAPARMTTADADDSSNVVLRTKWQGRPGYDATMLTQSERLVSLLINYKA